MRVYCEVEQASSLGADAVVLNATVGAPYEGAELEKLGESVRGVVASCVAAMPPHEQFIARCCQAPVAA